MNRRPDRKTELLAETFHPDWEHGPAAEFARRAASVARRRRIVRHRLLAGGSLALLAAVFFVSQEKLKSPATGAGKAAPRVAQAPETPARAYEVISDDELLAELRDRPVLVVKTPAGTRNIIVLASNAGAEPLE